jgi:hypothetical protein
MLAANLRKAGVSEDFLGEFKGTGYFSGSVFRN